MTEVDSDTYDLLSEQLKQCILPEFDREIGDQPLEPADFYTFVRGLNMNLQLLFDVISKKEQLLLDAYDGCDEKFRVNFILLLQQQTDSADAPFQTNDSTILTHLRHLRDKYYKTLWMNQAVRKECLKYYKNQLTADKWKRNIGAVYGFVHLNKMHRNLIRTPFDADEMLFMLSVGMQLIDYFEPIYKTFGLTIFDILLEHGDSNELKRLNLVGVIYKRIMNPLIVVVTDEVNITLLLSCLLKCAKTFSSWKDPSQWNEVDDILEEVMRRLAFENDYRRQMILILFISRITTLPLDKNVSVRNATDFSQLTNIIPLNVVAVKKLREICGTYHNLLVGRWTKKLVEYFTQQTILGRPEQIQQQLNVMHICYLCCFFGNPLFAEMKTLDFWDSIIVNMLHLIKSNQDHDVFVKEIQEILTTIGMQIERICGSSDKVNDFHSFQLALESLQEKMEELKSEIKA